MGNAHRQQQQYLLYIMEKTAAADSRARVDVSDVPCSSLGMFAPPESTVWMSTDDSNSSHGTAQLITRRT